MTGDRVAVLLALSSGLVFGQGVVTGALSDFSLERTLALAGETHHVQGIDLDGERLWVTSVDTAHKKGYLQEFSLANGAVVRTVEVGHGARFHPGGLQADGDSLWLPVAEYRRESSATIQKRSKRTLELESQFDVADHIGCVAVTPTEVMGGNWDSREFYVWDRNGRQLRKVANPTGNGYQDLKFADGVLVASGLLPGGSGAIDWLGYSPLQLTRRVSAGKTDRGAAYTREGMAIKGDRLYLLPEDAPSRLFVFRMKNH